MSSNALQYEFPGGKTVGRAEAETATVALSAGKYGITTDKGSWGNGRWIFRCGPDRTEAVKAINGMKKHFTSFGDKHFFTPGSKAAKLAEETTCTLAAAVYQTLSESAVLPNDIQLNATYIFGNQKVRCIGGCADPEMVWVKFLSGGLKRVIPARELEAIDKAVIKEESSTPIIDKATSDDWSGGAAATDPTVAKEMEILFHDMIDALRALEGSEGWDKYCGATLKDAEAFVKRNK